MSAAAHQGGRIPTDKIVVAVPTKNRDAFSPPGLIGWWKVLLLLGNDVGILMSAARSRVGCDESLGLIWILFIANSECFNLIRVARKAKRPYFRDGPSSTKQLRHDLDGHHDLSSLFQVITSKVFKSTAQSLSL